jgi:hypothetical protein
MKRTVTGERKKKTTLIIGESREREREIQPALAEIIPTGMLMPSDGPAIGKCDTSSCTSTGT